MEHVSVAPGAVSHEDRDQMVVRFERAVASRQEIDQAKGILIATYRMSGDEAWSLLSNVSQHCNVKVRSLAQALIQIVSETEFPVEPAHEVARRYLLPRDRYVHPPEALGAADRRRLGDARDLLAANRDAAATSRDKEAFARDNTGRISANEAAADRAAAREDRRQAAIDRQVSADDRDAAERAERSR